MKKILLLLLFLLSVSSCTNNNPNCHLSSELSKGLEEMIKEEKYNDVISKLLPSARNGDKAAQYFVGFYMSITSHVDAFKWSMLSAKQDCISGMILVGNAYRHGKSVEQNSTLAFKWYLRAAEMGDKSSAKLVSFLYQKGEGVEKDEEKAYYWHEQVYSTEK